MGLLLSGASHIYTPNFVLLHCVFVSISSRVHFSAPMRTYTCMERYHYTDQMRKLSKHQKMMGTEIEAHEYWLHIKDYL